MAFPEQHAIDATMAAAGTKATYTGGVTTLAGWLLSSEFGILIGVILGVAGFIVQVYYSRKRDKREAARHEHEMAEFRRRMGGE